MDNFTCSKKKEKSSVSSFVTEIHVFLIFVFCIIFLPSKGSKQQFLSKPSKKEGVQRNETESLFWLLLPESAEQRESNLRRDDHVILSPVLVGEVVLDGVGKVQLFDLALLDALLVDVLADHSSAKVHQRKRLSWKRTGRFKSCPNSASCRKTS